MNRQIEPKAPRNFVNPQDEVRPGRTEKNSDAFSKKLPFLQVLVPAQQVISKWWCERKKLGSMGC